MKQCSGIIVIGAGVIGLSAALALQARGFDVTVVERDRPAAGASAGNAGAFAFTDILPLASPGILRNAPRWLLDPLGPLSIRPSYAMQIAPWLFRFWKACAARNVASSIAAQAALNDLSKNELESFLTATGTQRLLRKKGNLQLYDTEVDFRTAGPGWDMRAKHGIEFHHLTPAGIADLQPGIAPRFTHGTFTPDWYSVTDPSAFTMALCDRFLADGGTLLRAEAAALAPGDQGVTVTMTNGSKIAAAKVIVAAGAHSLPLARSLGDRIPLDTERGYNTTLPTTAFDLRTQLTFGGHGFVVTSLSSGIRVGGAVEFGGLILPPNFRRADVMLQKAKTFLPNLATEGGTQWMGFRPSLPDSLPAIGRARITPDVIYAFGHGHLGLTQCAGTARLLADLVCAARPAIDLSPFSPQRF